MSSFHVFQPRYVSHVFLLIKTVSSSHYKEEGVQTLLRMTFEVLPDLAAALYTATPRHIAPQ
jgi:hypothetical protein